jgi:uncharacterized protein YjlB
MLMLMTMQHCNRHGVDSTQTGPKWRNNYCKGEESLDDLRKEIAEVGIPDSDPVYGVNGPLVKIWKTAAGEV